MRDLAEELPKRRTGDFDKDGRAPKIDIKLDVRVEVSTAVTMKNAVFWDVASYRYLVSRRFGGTYRIHLQGIRNPRAMNRREQVAVDSGYQNISRGPHPRRRHSS
jgi:hypothetical protein